MTSDNETKIEEKTLPVKIVKTPLSEDELQAVWKQDEYHGKGGSYDCDPFTGKRTPKKED